MKINRLNNLNRFSILIDGELIQEVPSIRGVARFVGCTYQHLYNEMSKTNTTTFKFKKVQYTIIDKLETMQ